MTKQITNDNNQTSLSQRQALLYCLGFEKLDLEYCLEYLEFGTWKLRNILTDKERINTDDICENPLTISVNLMQGVFRLLFGEQKSAENSLYPYKYVEQ